MSPNSVHFVSNESMDFMTWWVMNQQVLEVETRECRSGSEKSPQLRTCKLVALGYHFAARFVRG